MSSPEFKPLAVNTAEARQIGPLAGRLSIAMVRLSTKILPAQKFSNPYPERRIYGYLKPLGMRNKMLRTARHEHAATTL